MRTLLLRSVVVTLGFAGLLLTVASPALSQTDPERGIEQARALYRQGRFAEAIVELRSVIDRLAELQDLGEKRKDLANAHFLLGLAYFGVRDEGSAKENFLDAAVFDPEFRPDPDVFAPRVVTLYQEAIQESLAAGEAPSRDEPTEAPRGAIDRRDLLGVGVRVRAAISDKGTSVVGDVLQVDEHTLTLLSRDRQTVEIPRSSIRTLEFSEGRHGHPWWGAVIGAGAGAALGAVETPDGPECVGENCFTRGENIGYGALAGGLIGALAGALVRTERWLEMPSDVLAVRIGANRYGVGLSVTLAF